MPLARRGRDDPAAARSLPPGGDQGDPDPGAPGAPPAGPRRVTAAEFVAQLDETNQAVLRRLEPEATLKPEVSGALNVTNLLKVALKNEIEATEIAARWLVTTTDVEVKMAFARQAGDEAKHYRMIAERLRGAGVGARSFPPPPPA